MAMKCLNTLVCLSAFSLVSAQLYELNIVHYNDFHARFVETSLAGTICNPTAPCIGGFARLTTLIRQALAREPDSLLLNGGDSFQGTIWYNLLRWNVTQDFMNMLPHDAHALGNHEFDNGIEGVVPYLQHLNSTVVAANIIADDEPTIQGLFQPSMIVERKGRKIGIIGAIIATTNELASTGKLIFTDEVEAVKREAEKLNEQGVDIIVVLSHCGLDIDREIAMNSGPYIDIIVGAHSHSLLINSDPPEGIPFTPRGTYPVVVEQQNKTVLIVQAAAYTAYLGEIKLSFNDQGDLMKWEGYPHFVDNEVEQAPDVLEKINQYLPLVSERANEQVGVSKVHLSSRCACDECNLGSFICDAFLDAVIEKAEGNKWNFAHFCVINQGGVRTDIEPGNVTLEHILLSTPFENRVEVFDLKGQHILEMLEFAVTNEPYPGARMVQVSGLRAVFDGALPINSRVINATVRCIECVVPRYEPLDLNKMYKVVSQTFVANGGDGFTEELNLPRCSTVDWGMYMSQNDRYMHVSLRFFIAENEIHFKRLSGLRIIFDGSQPIGNRVINVTVRCIECDVPRYLPLVQDQYYKVVSQDFIGNGGGGYTMISNNRENVEIIGVDYDVVLQYMKRQALIIKDLDGRIQITDPCIQN